MRTTSSTGSRTSSPRTRWEDGEPSSFGLEFLLEQDFERVVTLGATAVVRSYDYRSQFADIEDMSATSVGVYARWRSTARTQWFLSYSYDRDFKYWNPDLEALHTIRAQFQYRFLTWAQGLGPRGKTSRSRAGRQRGDGGGGHAIFDLSGRLSFR